MCDSLPSSHLLFPCALRFSNEYYENLDRKSFNIYSSGRARSCNWNMARDICEANDFGLSACRVQRKSICTRSIKISRLPHGFEYIQACANDLSFNKLLKFTLKSVFENFYFACGFILMSIFFLCIYVHVRTEEQARVSCSNLIAHSCFRRNSITVRRIVSPFLYLVQFHL